MSKKNLFDNLKSIYEKIGVAADASKEDIKNAHRDFVKKNHPDKGGDEEVFKKGQEYFVTLLDDEKRKHYDETGQEEKQQGPNKVVEEAIKIIQSLIVMDPDNIDKYLAEMKQTVIKKINRRSRQIEQEKSKFEAFLKRITVKDKTKQNAVINFIEISITTCENQINLLDNDLQLNDDIHNYIKETFDFENREEMFSRFGDLTDDEIQWHEARLHL